jgi:hypothetical protein
MTMLQLITLVTASDRIEMDSLSLAVIVCQIGNYVKSHWTLCGLELSLSTQLS